jgi:hypothetical protein
MFDFVPFPEADSWGPSTSPSASLGRSPGSSKDIERLDWVRSMTDTPLNPSSVDSNGLSSEHEGLRMARGVSNGGNDLNDVEMHPDPCSSVAINYFPETETPSSKNMLEHRPRKGHKKSRRGCYNCKRRKIKVGSLALCPPLRPFLSPA